MSRSIRTSSYLLALLLAVAALLLVASAQSQAAASAGQVRASADGVEDGVCDYSEVDDPDCIDFGDEGDTGDWGDDPAGSDDSAGDYDGVCDDTSGIDEFTGEVDPDCADSGDEEEPEPELWPAPPKGAYATLSEGSRKAKAPKSAPKPVRQMIKAANELVKKPYKWGGGHARWKDRGYDCSGAVSYVLRAGGYLKAPLSSGGLMKWGVKGGGNWVTVYASKKHVFLVVAGLRFDTTPYGAKGGKGPRWRATVRPTKGFKLRHPRGL